MAKDEIQELRELRDAYDRAREALLAGIFKHSEAGETHARIGRSVDWTREYIGKLHKAKTPADGSGSAS